MERRSFSLRARQIAPLIILVQAQLSAAHPFRNQERAGNGTPSRGRDQHFAPQNQVPPSLNGVQTTSWPSTTC